MFSPKITIRCWMGVTGCPRGVVVVGVVGVVGVDAVVEVPLEQPAAARANTVAAAGSNNLCIMVNRPQKIVGLGFEIFSQKGIAGKGDAIHNLATACE
jgi:hypothetical protein